MKSFKELKKGDKILCIETDNYDDICYSTHLKGKEYIVTSRDRDTITIATDYGSSHMMDEKYFNKHFTNVSSIIIVDLSKFKIYENI